MKTMTFSISKISLVLFVLSILIVSCEDTEGPKGAYENGAFIVNEGGFKNNNGSVSFYNYDSDEVSNNIFNTINSRPLGDVVQSVKLFGDYAFIVVNNSNKVEIVNRYTFEEVDVIENVLSPRYMEAYGTKAYLSCWGDNSVKVIDIATSSVSKSIPVGTGPEGMAISNGKLFVANTGGWGTDSTISVIDLVSEEIVDTIAAKFVPKSLVVDKDGNIWALSSGKVVYDYTTWETIEETPSMLYKIDAATNSVLMSGVLFENSHPSIIQIDKDGTSLYVGGNSGNIFGLEVEGTKLTATNIIGDFAYGFSYDKQSDVLFVGIPPDFVKAGILKRYSTDGNLLGEYSVGVGPSGASFKNTK